MTLTDLYLESISFQTIFKRHILLSDNPSALHYTSYLVETSTSLSHFSYFSLPLFSPISHFPSLLPLPSSFSLLSYFSFFLLSVPANVQLEHFCPRILNTRQSGIKVLGPLLHNAKRSSLYLFSNSSFSLLSSPFFLFIVYFISKLSYIVWGTMILIILLAVISLIASTNYRLRYDYSVVQWV